MKTYTHQDPGTGRLMLVLTQDDIDSVPSSGPADEAIAALRRDPRIEAQLQAGNMNHITAHLGEYGAWDRVELMDFDENLNRWLWLAICDIRESPNDYYSEET